MRGRLSLTLLLAVLILTGCAGQKNYQVLTPSDRPAPDSGYVYGRFNLKAIPASCDLGVALVLHGERDGEKHEHLMKFVKVKDPDTLSDAQLGEAKDGILGMAVPPGKYAVGHAAFLYEDDSEYSRKSFDRHFGVFTVEGGAAYYIGDFTATAKCITKTAQGYNYSWFIREAAINFPGTTADFDDRYRHFRECRKISIFGD